MGGNYTAKLWGEFVFLRHHHNVKMKKETPICHNALLCVHYACICLKFNMTLGYATWIRINVRNFNALLFSVGNHSMSHRYQEYI